MADAKQLLIIDDDSRNIFALTAVLRAKGYTIHSATSAAEGIECLFKEKGIKVVLMDIMMPDMDGYEAITAIRGQDALKDVKLIAVTAQAMVGDREKCLEAGADDYVSKPIDVDLLLQLLETYQ
ncbi:MAG TPA: response regulator [Flavisolibacter sp.]|jgi:CheY-like chemotaxis protein|nr:response regulator [Flavisolibacter sp.]